MSTTVLRETTSVKLDKETKDEAKRIFKELGLSMGEALNMFLYQVKLNQGMPFEIKIPNKETRMAMEEVNNGVNVEEFSLNELKHNETIKTA